MYRKISLVVCCAAASALVATGCRRLVAPREIQTPAGPAAVHTDSGGNRIVITPPAPAGRGAGSGTFVNGN